MGTRYNRLFEAVLTSTHNLCFEQKFEKYPNFYLKFYISLLVKFLVCLNRLVFVMFPATGVKCRVAAVKSLPVLHHSVGFLFFVITEPIVVTLKIEYRLNRRNGVLRRGGGCGGEREREGEEAACKLHRCI